MRCRNCDTLLPGPGKRPAQPNVCPTCGGELVYKDTVYGRAVIHGGGTLTAVGVANVIGPAFIAYLVPPDHYHLPADHHDLIAYGIEVGLILALLFVGGTLVARRPFGLER